jgi:hypothetical protein
MSQHNERWGMKITRLSLLDDVDGLHVKIGNLNKFLVGFCLKRDMDIRLVKLHFQHRVDASDASWVLAGRFINFISPDSKSNPRKLMKADVIARSPWKICSRQRMF